MPGTSSGFPHCRLTFRGGKTIASYDENSRQELTQPLPVPNYSVLKGDPQRGEVVFGRGGTSPHYRIYMNSDSGQLEADVNIQSSDGSEVLYVIYDPFVPPNAEGLVELPLGITPLNRVPGSLALDYIREMTGGGMLVNRADMSLLPIPTQDPQEQLKNAVIELLNQAVADPAGAIYAFGSSYADANGTSGVHNLHMNQGNPPGRFESDNGIWQDGAVFFNLPASDTWKALFIAFQTESWQTDDQGDAIGATSAERGRS